MSQVVSESFYMSAAETLLKLGFDDWIAVNTLASPMTKAATITIRAKRDRRIASIGTPTVS